MGDGRGRKMAIRRANPARKAWQMKVLNTLRLSYFLSPTMLKSEGFKNEPTTDYVTRILKARYSRPTNKRDLPMLVPRGVYSFNLNDPEAQAVLDVVYEQIAERMPFPRDKHKRYIVPSEELQNAWVYYNEKIIKAEKNFKRFLEIVVIFQNFELYKLANHSKESDMTDSDIAQAIYFDANEITSRMLETVRQYRKRLKEYKLI